MAAIERRQNDWLKLLVGECEVALSAEIGT